MSSCGGCVEQFAKKKIPDFDAGGSGRPFACAISRRQPLVEEESADGNSADDCDAEQRSEHNYPNRPHIDTTCQASIVDA